MFHPNRRDLLRATGMSLAGFSMSGWMSSFAQACRETGSPTRHCILLWMPGGPSQTDTFDMKPDHENGGEFKPIKTNVPGIHISEHLPTLAQHVDKMAIIRGLSTAEGDHDRGTYLMHTGQRPGGPISYPTIGSSISKSLGSDTAELPNFISISPYTAFSRPAFRPGFLGPKYAPLTVGVTNSEQAAEGESEGGGYASFGVADLENRSVSQTREDARLEIWNSLQSGFMERHNGAAIQAQNTVYQRAVKMMRGRASKAFDLSDEPAALRDAYGKGRFGQGCLMARRLIEHGVPFIELALTGEGQAASWDTHGDNFNVVKSLSAELDRGWGTLMSDLQERGLLESTTILWMGEFGRTPVINEGGGRDHFPSAWTSVLAGGGIAGGQAYGETSADGQTVVDGMTDVGDLLATLCAAVGVDPDEQNMSGFGRPIRIAEGLPIKAVLS